MSMTRKKMPEGFADNLRLSMTDIPFEFGSGKRILVSHTDMKFNARLYIEFPVPAASPIKPAGFPEVLLMEGMDFKHMLAEAFWSMFGAEAYSYTPDNFASHPKSVSEIKANKTWDSADAKPRDVLVSILRDIDNGDHPDLDAAIVILREMKEADGKRRPSVFYALASPDPHATLGLLARTAHDINVQASEE